MRASEEQDSTMKTLKRALARFSIGRGSEWEFDCLGRHVKQDPKDFHIEIYMQDCCSKLE